MGPVPATLICDQCFPVVVLHDHPRHSCAWSDERPILNVWHDERTDRAVIAAVSDAHMAMAVPTQLYLLRVEQVTSRDEEPAGNRFHQLIADHGKAIHIAAAG